VFIYTNSATKPRLKSVFPCFVVKKKIFESRGASVPLALWLAHLKISVKIKHELVNSNSIEHFVSTRYHNNTSVFPEIALSD
jgi:hypothetical protein